jgi:hypothetical protein
MNATTAPAMPYATEDRPFGVGRDTRPVKLKPAGTVGNGDWLTDDEVAVLAYVRHLEAENARLRAELDAATVKPDAVVPAPEVKADAPAAKKGKKS